MKSAVRGLHWLVLLVGIAFSVATLLLIGFRPSRHPQRFSEQIRKRFPIGVPIASVTNELARIGFIASKEARPKTFFYQDHNDGSWLTVSNVDLVVYSRRDSGFITVSIWTIAFAIDGEGNITNILCSYLKDFKPAP